MGSSSDSSTKGDFFDKNMIYILVGSILLLARTWLDVFIVTVNYRDWRKKKHLNTTDRILTLHGCIRICLGWVDMIWCMLSKFCPWISQSGYVFRAFSFSFWYILAFSVWLTASLCSYYCVKIADFSHPFFIHLKQRLSGLGSAAWLLGSAILSLASSLPFWYNDLEIQGNRSFSHLLQNKNATYLSHHSMMIMLRMQTLKGLGYCAAFSICATAAVLLLFSLWRHRQRMLSSWDGHGSPRTVAHFQAVITILSLLVNNIVVFICIQLLLSKYLVANSVSMGASFSLYCCMSLESLISIRGNKKLKNEIRRSFCFAKCRECVCLPCLVMF